MATLSDHLQKAGVSQIQFARALGISTSYMSELVARLKEPSLSLALQIQEATGGDVTVSDLALNKATIRPERRNQPVEKDNLEKTAFEARQ